MSKQRGLLPADLHVLERGWLSSNSLLMCGDPRGAVLVDTGYCTHKHQTLALVQSALADEPGLRLIANTHLHSDHCGGNAHLAAHFDCPIWVPPGHFQAALDWDQDALSFATTGQKAERFTPTAALQPGSTLHQANREWQIHAAPGHDPHSILLFNADNGVLMSADALWEHGFGIVFPEIEGAPGFDEVATALDLIADLPVCVVIPGHGPVFTDVKAALAEARSRLAFFKLNPTRHARHAAKALIKYHMLEVISQTRAELIDWLSKTPIHRQIWQRFFKSSAIEAWSLELLNELSSASVIRVNGELIHNQ